MNEAEEIFIPTETQHLRAVRHWGLTIFIIVSLLIIAASLVAAFAD